MITNPIEMALSPKRKLCNMYIPRFIAIRLLVSEISQVMSESVWASIMYKQITPKTQTIFNAVIVVRLFLVG